MPLNIINSFAKQSGKSATEVEKMWSDARKSVDKEYPDIEPESEAYFKLVTAVLKNMLKIEDSSAAITTSNLGGTTNGTQTNPNAYKFYRRLKLVKRFQK